MLQSKQTSIRSELLQSTKQRHNPRLIEQQFANYKKNVSIFKKSVEQQIKKLTQSHKIEIKKLMDKIQKQNKIIQQYEKQYGKLNKIDISKIQTDYIQSPRKVESFLKQQDIKQTTIKLKKSKYLESKGIEKETDSFMINQEQLYIPPDQMYKSRFQSNNKMKKETHRDLYLNIKQNKKIIDTNTAKVLDSIGKSPTKVQKITFINEEKQSIQLKSALKKPKDESELLNSSLSFICDSLDRLSKSKSAKKKRKTEKPKKLKQNSEAQKEIQAKRKLQFVLRNMRDKINLKNQQASKVEQIKQSKLLPTGEGSKRGSKVLINPIPIDLTKKVEDGAGMQCPSPTKSYSSILKKSSVDAKSIQGLSAISYHTRESRNSSKYF